MDGLDIAVGQASPQVSGYRNLQPRRPLQSRVKRHGKMLSLLLFVMLPTALVATYYIGFAADQYVSEAKFVVRGPATQSPGMISSLLQTAGVSRAQDDTYAVQDFIVSRDALAELVKSQELRDIFSRPEADVLSRFPLLFRGETFEHLFYYYQKHVEVALDTTTGVSTLTVKAFRPDDSHVIATALLASAERLVNRMNDRQRENAMGDARREIGLSEARVQGVSRQIAEFRNRESLLDPNKQSVPMLAGINDMQTMLSRTNLQLSQLAVSSPNSPLIADYKRRATALQGQIAEAKAKITGADGSLVPKISAFDMLSLQREFADRQLSSATTSLEAARIQAERQQLYLDLIVQPNVADYAAYPKCIASILIAFVSFLGLYCMVALLISGAREHRIV